MEIRTGSHSTRSNSTRVVVKYIVAGFIMLVVLSILFGSFYTISAGFRGVLLTFGEASDVAVTEGLHFKFPFAQSVVKMEVRTLKYEAG